MSEDDKEINFSPNSLEEDSDLELTRPVGTHNNSMMDDSKKNNHPSEDDSMSKLEKLRMLGYPSSMTSNLPPVGDDGISECVIYLCKYCKAASLDKDSADKHVISLDHYIKYKSFLETNNLLQKST